MSSTRDASFLFQSVASSTRTMCARSASARDGRWSPVTGATMVEAWRNSMSDGRIERLFREPLAVERQPLRCAIPCKEALGEDRNVHLPLAQRGQPDRKGVDA